LPGNKFRYKKIWVVTTFEAQENFKGRRPSIKIDQDRIGADKMSQQTHIPSK